MSAASLEKSAHAPGPPPAAESKPHVSRRGMKTSLIPHQTLQPFSLIVMGCSKASLLPHFPQESTRLRVVRSLAQGLRAGT